MNFNLQEKDSSISRSQRIGFRKAIHVFTKSRKSVFFGANEHDVSNLVMYHIDNDDSNLSKVEIKEIDRIIETAHMLITDVVLKTI